MVKKLAISAGVFAFSAFAAGTVAFAQTATPTTSPTTAPTVSATTPTPTTTLPGGAPATGRGL